MSDHLLRVSTSDGLHCKACDSPALVTDTELCEVCLMVVCEVNQDIYQKEMDAQYAKEMYAAEEILGT